ncbi:hypothetical protein [Asticcacaulis benevestitus]|uniref:Uncharacterized protein n=1 Tax=Asticcacaulis benevestitus DSM 16100 = ATCC BAA-896 TaxID=1121022 RepID=V4RNK8_9CAUL|nr:hypothetical protein [Asticcacaulis benevestitus]ESQ92823.1 hypothetical protein ABENE_06895 [Asticcacaulis benevestitus DSM 16100 = ATCC BAA-896]
MRVPELDLDQWISAALWCWMHEEIDMEGVRAELFDLMRLPDLEEKLEALNVYFDVLLLRFESGAAMTEETVAALIDFIDSTQSPA